MFRKPPLGPIPYLPPSHYCYAPDEIYTENHGVDGLKWDNDKQKFSDPCPYCVPLRSNN
jgi:hypothetical protein